ncbi:MAG TPA: hypothetical protein VMU04_06955 [Candidatus Acidoferrum sp.]|nr:hypothetical protein [Candidatus Acidoferrum sp.]
MTRTISAKELRASLRKVVQQVRRGAQFIVLYRGQPAFQLVPVDAAARTKRGFEHDPLYRAKGLGRSTDGLQAVDHDSILYRK